MESTQREVADSVTSVAIIGSCVTRDAFEFDHDKRYDIAHYSARTGLGSFMGPATELLEADFDRIASAFQRRVVGWDIDKSGRNWLRSNDPQIIVYDPIDERFALAIFPDDGILTLSSEFSHLKVDPDSYRRIVPWTNEHFTRWRQGWSTFIRLLEEVGLRDRLVVHLAYWGTRVEQTGEVSGNAEEIEKANAWLARAETVMRQSLDEDRFLKMSDDLTVVDGDHRWGISPFHYVEPYYIDFLEQFGRAVERIKATAGDGLGAMA